MDEVKVGQVRRSPLGSEYVVDAIAGDEAWMRHPDDGQHITYWLSEVAPWPVVEPLPDVPQEVWVNVYPDEVASGAHHSRVRADDVSVSDRIAVAVYRLDRMERT